MDDVALEAISPTEARRKLKLSAPMFNAVVKSRLVGGRFRNGYLTEAGIEQFQKYGTQWWDDDRPDLEYRVLTVDQIKSLLRPPDVAHEEDRPDIQTNFYIVSDEVPENARDTDTGWIAQFYLTPNVCFFPAPTTLGMIGPLPLKLATPKQVQSSELPTRLYPDPSGSLAMVTVTGIDQPTSKARRIAYDVASPILDELSAKYDQPLPVAHTLIVGIPSGLMSTSFPSIPNIETIDEAVLPACPYPELRDAVALYREGVSSNNPFHQFLALWRAYENVCGVRGQWRKKHRQRVTKIHDEVFPEEFAFGGYEGLTFEEVKQKLEAPYRVAVAHGRVKGDKKPKTAATAENLLNVSYVVPIIRFMASVTLDNARATLASTQPTL